MQACTLNCPPGMCLLTALPRLAAGFITKSYLRSASAAKDLFFSADVRDADMNRCACTLAATWPRKNALETPACYA